VVVTNWTVTSNPASKRALKVAGPGSVRIEEDSTWVTTSGYWEPAPGNDPVNGAFAFWSQGRAVRAAASGASVTVETHCQYTHANLRRHAARYHLRHCDRHSGRRRAG